MSRHAAVIRWERGDARFVDGRYSRAHTWTFDGGAVVPGSSSPHVVPAPYSNPGAVDPEEAFVASLSSCHMLWFLSIAQGRGFRVDRYVDEAVGTMARNAEGKLAITRVTLHPQIAFSGERTPSRAELDAMHHEAHEQCFIANSVRTEVLCEPVVEE
jgi:organic hydroperoxide reductase OsmC/OhrA